VDEALLVTRSQAGDAGAFADLFERYHAKTYRIAFAIARNRQLAEDITQEAFVQAFRAIGNIRPGEPFGPWFYRLVVRQARRMARPFGQILISLEAWRERGLETADPAASVQIDQMETKEQVWRAMASLSHLHREVLVLRYFADLTEEQVAQATETSPGTVKSRLHHARRLLAERLRRQEAPPAAGPVLTE
jgi:RNA polymerase sigma factor (sigma-70 family)